MIWRPSEASSPGSAVSTSDWNEPDGTAGSRSSGTPSASESSPGTGPMFPGLETSTRFTGLWPTPRATDADRGGRGDLIQATRGNQNSHFRAPTVSHGSISSPAAFLASRSPSPGSSDGWTTIVGYGPSSREPFASYDPASSSWRTFQGSLWEAGWEPFSETWPSSGMTRNGRAFPRRPLVPRTSVTGSGSSLTGKETHHVPTPTASDHIERVSTSTEVLNFDTHKSVSLDRWANRWPTPTSRDHKDTGDSIANGTVPVNGLLGRAVGPSTTGGALNPTWVEWLMGFPLGWTDLGPSATRSSRRSSK